MSNSRTRHPYFMYDAIREQPARVAAVLESRRAVIEEAAQAAARKHRILFAGIGTSYHAAQIATYFLRHLTGGRSLAQVEHSFELVHYPPILSGGDAIVIISHRGWKSYSVQASERARKAGALTILVSGAEAAKNVKQADYLVETCEQELSSAHTKSFTTALAALALFAQGVAWLRRQADEVSRRDESEAGLERIRELPHQMERALSSEPEAQKAARTLARCRQLLFIGAGPNWPTACEAALKVKETSYIPAEGLETEQFLHGPIQELEPGDGLVTLLAGGAADERAFQVLEAAGELGVVRVVLSSAASRPSIPVEYFLPVPWVEEWLSPFVIVVAAQLLSYHLALERRTNPDTGRQDQAQHARAQELYQL